MLKIRQKLAPGPPTGLYCHVVPLTKLLGQYVYQVPVGLYGLIQGR